MKKLVFGLIATVMLSVCSFGQKSENFEEYGMLHNDCVNLFLSSGKSISDYKNLDDFAKDYYKMVLEKFPSIGFTEEEFLVEFKKTFLDSFNESGSSRIAFENQLLKLYDEKMITMPFYKTVIEIMNSEGEYNKILNLIDEIQKTELNDYEKKSIGIFKSVFESSNSLWTNYNGSSSKLKDGSWTIIGDAVGALVFCYIPPLAAVAAGGISLMVHNCKPHC
jgi:hypothetical protein